MTEKTCCDDHKMKIFGNVVVGAKGQIVIPKEVRELLDIKPGDNLVMVTKHDMAVGIIKNSDIEKFMEYMKRELEVFSALKNS